MRWGGQAINNRARRHGALPPPNQQMRSALLGSLDQAQAFGRVIIDGGILGTTPSELGLHDTVR